MSTESAVELMYAAKDAGGNPKNTTAHGKVDEKASFMQKAVNELTYTLEQAGGEAGLITGGCGLPYMGMVSYAIYINDPEIFQWALVCSVVDS